MKEVASPLAILPGAQPAKHGAPGRKASDRDADFEAALAMILGGQKIGAPPPSPAAGVAAVVPIGPPDVPAQRHQPNASVAGAVARQHAVDGRAAAAHPLVDRPAPGAHRRPAEGAGAIAPSVGEGMDKTAPTPPVPPTPHASPASPVSAAPASPAARPPGVRHDPVAFGTRHADGRTPAAAPSPRSGDALRIGDVPTTTGAVFDPAKGTGRADKRVDPGNARIAVSEKPRTGAVPSHPAAHVVSSASQESLPEHGRWREASAKVASTLDLPKRDRTPPAGAAKPEPAQTSAATAASTQAGPAAAARDDRPVTREARRNVPQGAELQPAEAPVARAERLAAPPVVTQPIASQEVPPAPTALQVATAAAMDDAPVSFALGSHDSNDASQDHRHADAVRVDPRVGGPEAVAPFAAPQERIAATPAAPPAAAARPAPLPQDDASLAGLDAAGLVVDAGGAKLSVRDTRSGDLALDVRIHDGSLDIRAGGSAAPVVAANEAELRLALAGAGMRLGQLAVEASVEGRVQAAPLAANAERRRGRGEERDTKRIDGKEPREDGDAPAFVHVKV